MVFLETFLILASSKLCKSHDVDIKLYLSQKQIVKNRNLSVILMKYFHSQVMNIFVEVLNKEFWGKSFFLIKLKRKLIWRIADTLLQILRKTLQNQILRRSHLIKDIWSSQMPRGYCKSGHNSGGQSVVFYGKCSVYQL